MADQAQSRHGLVLGLLAGVGAVAGAGVLLWRGLRKRGSQANTSAAFAGEGAPAGAFVQTRDAGPEHIRDENAADWDALDQASDESFPSSDPPAANDFRTPKPIVYPN